MPHKQNPSENGLCRSPCLKELREKEDAKNRKAHVPFGKAAATKIVFGLFLLFALASNLTIQKK